MELSDTLLQNLFGFVSGLIGAVIGGVFTLYATHKAIRAQNAKDDRQEEKEVENLLAALGVEIGTLWDFHMSRIGAMVEALKPGDALEFYYPLTQDYFTVYNENASSIGKIRDEALRTAIVRCYNKCKKVVDGFKYNNEIYRHWRDYADRLGEEGFSQKLADTKYKALTEYAMLIQTDHIETKGYVENLRSLLIRSSHAQ